MISGSSLPPTSFHPFPRLPIELRLKIWSLALVNTHPQLFNITTHYKIIQRRRHRITTILATAPPPALLHTNQEARFQSLEHYSLIPGITISYNQVTQVTPPDLKYVFVNFSIDIFDVQGTLADIPYNLSRPLKRIQRLRTVARNVVWFGEHFENSRVSEIDGLRELEVRVLEGAAYDLRGFKLEDSGVQKLVEAFDRARRAQPGWVFPRVIVVEGFEVLRVYEGGVWSGDRRD